MKKNRIFLAQNRAFTMLELIFVIVILGIVASIGSEVIANVYKNYILQRATHRATLKTELAAQQIANLLSYRIPGTTIAKNPDDLTDYLLVTEVADPTNPEDDTHTLLEWIGSASDSFSAAQTPGWSGFCDIAASSQSTVKTPGSDLSLADDIISNLSGGEVSLSGSGDQRPAIFFRDFRYAFLDTSGNSEKLYDVKNCMGVTDSDRTCISSVDNSDPTTNPTTLTFQHNDSIPNKLIAEHYKLAWTAYAIWQKPRPGGKAFDLELYYNYQPWENEQLTTNRPHSTLVKNVTVFKFAELGGTFRFKLCVQENIGEDYNVTICKEKAVIL